MEKLFRYFNLLVFASSSLVLIAFQQKPWGFGLLALGLVSLLFCSREFKKSFVLIYFCLAVLGLTPIGTTTDFPQASYMGLGLFLVVAVPLFVTRKIYKNDTIRYPNLRQRNWPKAWTFYLLFTAFAGYLLLPIMLRSADSYTNWHLVPGFWDLAVAYVGLNMVGIWDELFFIITVLALLRHHFPFFIANLAQAILFTSFLYTLGFGGWCFIVIFAFALAQGLVFRRTKSVIYILAIHLTIDLVLHLALVYLHFPHLFPYFVT
jgi:membrane protease YdiL (CAAX protease family)